MTWKIYTTTGERLPHDQCPMAEAVREQRPSAARSPSLCGPTGAGVAFTPYPTPLFDKDGQLTGAVNMLIDVSEEQSEALAEQASAAAGWPGRPTTARFPRCSAPWPTAMTEPPRTFARAPRPSRLLTPLTLR